MSKNKIVAAGAVLIVLIIIASFSVMSIVQSNTVGNVENTQVGEVLDTSAELQWKKVSSADGYYIYKSFTGENNFEKAATVEDGKAESFVVEELEQATVYDFYVTAYKESKKNVESKEFETVTLCTPPSKQEIKSIASNEEGVMNFEWEINANAEGYQIQYIKGDGSDFTDAEEADITDKATPNYEVTGLEPKATYSVRVRSYITYNEEALPGEWSDVQSVEIAE